MPKRTHRNPDHVQRHNTPSPNNEAIANQLQALLTPAIWAQQNYYRSLGLRDRILNLSSMVAVVLTLLWRQVPEVQELTRLLAREDLLWCPCTIVSQQALSERFLTFPAELFERVFKDLLPKLQQNWRQRDKRPLPESINFALKYFEQIWVADGETSAEGGFPAPRQLANPKGSTLSALFCKLKSLEDVTRGQLAVKICTVIDIVTRLPVEVWFHTNPKASETNNDAERLNLVTAKTLLLLDRGFYHFQFFATLISQEVDFITRAHCRGCR